MKRFFFIDYENVDTKGLDGLSSLKSNDAVYFFYSEHHSRMNFGLHKRITESSSNFEYRKIKVTGKDALDEELKTELEELISIDQRAHYNIISKDKGYDNFVSQQKKNKIIINRCSDIVKANRIALEDVEKIVYRRLVENKNNNNRFYSLENGEIKKIAKLIISSDAKSELNRGLQQLFYNEDVKYIFTRIRDLTYNM